MTFETYEDSRFHGEPVNLYQFTYGAGASDYYGYCDAETSLSIGGKTYEPMPIERGEEVLTRSDPRHRYNGGTGGTESGGGSVEPKINIINAIDAGDFVSKGLGTPAGEKAILNWMRANTGAVKQALR